MTDNPVDPSKSESMTITLPWLSSLLVLSRTAFTASPNWTRHAPFSFELPIKSSVLSVGLMARRMLAHLGCRSSRYAIAGSLPVSLCQYSLFMDVHLDSVMGMIGSFETLDTYCHLPLTDNSSGSIVVDGIAHGGI